MAEYIDKEAVLNCIDKDGRDGEYDLGYGPHNREFQELIKALPAADVREVVLCGECYLHTHCRTEDVFDFAGLREENRFCSIGKRKTNSAKMEVQDG